MVMPGDTATMTVELGKPIAADVGLGFAVREGGQDRGSRHRHPPARLNLGPPAFRAGGLSAQLSPASL